MHLGRKLPVIMQITARAQSIPILRDQQCHVKYLPSPESWWYFASQENDQRKRSNPLHRCLHKNTKHVREKE